MINTVLSEINSTETCPFSNLQQLRYINKFFRQHGSTIRQCSSRSALRHRCQQSLRWKMTTFQLSLLTVKTRKSLSSKSTKFFIIIKTQKLKFNSKLLFSRFFNKRNIWLAFIWNELNETLRVNISISQFSCWYLEISKPIIKLKSLWDIY